MGVWALTCAVYVLEKIPVRRIAPPDAGAIKIGHRGVHLTLDQPRNGERLDNNASVDGLFSDAAVSAAFLPDVLKAVTIGGHVQAVPIDVPRESAFFYNMTLFGANN